MTQKKTNRASRYWLENKELKEQINKVLQIHKNINGVCWFCNVRYPCMTSEVLGVKE